MKEILLTQGKSAFVDDKDFESLNAFKWYAMKIGNAFYATRHSPKINGKYHHIYMHRMIINTPDGMETDHIDRNGLNNQRNNLRIVTSQQNAFNRNAKGFYFNKNSQKFRAQIQLNGKNINLGYFETELEAQTAYLEAKHIYHVI